MQDKETGTLWSHITGEAMDGDLTGNRLEMLPSVQTNWRQWFQQHPGTKVLRKEADITGSRYERYFADPDRIGIFRSRWLMDRMPGKKRVFGLTVGPHALAVAENKIISGEILTVDVGGKPVVVFRSLDGGVKGFIAIAGDIGLTFTVGEDTAIMVDEETQSEWDLTTGVCVKGTLEKTTLQEILVRRAYWFAWSSFYPNTLVID